MLINWEIESPQNVASFLLASGTLLNVLTYSVIKCVSVKRKSITLKTRVNVNAFLPTLIVLNVLNTLTRVSH